MRIAIDFDGTIVQDGHPYEDVTTPLKFIPGAKEGLLSLKKAGHQLLLWSARASRALLEDPMLDPFRRAGVRPPGRDFFDKWQAVNKARHQQMLDFVAMELPGVFDAVDDGLGGKPSVDLFIDDKALRLGYGPAGLMWGQVAQIYGEPVYGEPLKGVVHGKP